MCSLTSSDKILYPLTALYSKRPRCGKHKNREVVRPYVPTLTFNLDLTHVTWMWLSSRDSSGSCEDLSLDRIISTALNSINRLLRCQLLRVWAVLSVVFLESQTGESHAVVALIIGASKEAKPPLATGDMALPVRTYRVADTKYLTQDWEGASLIFQKETFRTEKSCVHHFINPSTGGKEWNGMEASVNSAR